MNKSKKRGGYRPKAGRPTRMESAMKRVNRLLPINDVPIRAKELEEKAEARGMSPTTLHDKLKKLMEAKIIKREEDRSIYPHPVYYRRITIPPWGDIGPPTTELKKISSRAWIVFESDMEMAEAQRQRLGQLFGKQPSKHRDDEIAAEIADELSTMAALIGRALAKIKEGEGISITPDEYVSRVLEIRLHPQVAQLARWIAENKITVSHLHDALIILASRQVRAIKKN